MILFVAVLLPTAPDYPRVAAVGEALPSCGDDFNAGEKLCFVDFEGCLVVILIVILMAILVFSCMFV